MGRANRSLNDVHAQCRCDSHAESDICAARSNQSLSGASCGGDGRSMGKRKLGRGHTQSRTNKKLAEDAGKGRPEAKGRASDGRQRAAGRVRPNIAGKRKFGKEGMQGDDKNGPDRKTLRASGNLPAQLGLCWRLKWNLARVSFPRMKSSLALLFRVGVVLAHTRC